MKKLQIGNVTLDNPVILAPMAGELRFCAHRRAHNGSLF